METCDLNFDAYKKLYSEGHLDHFRGTYVGLVDGIFVDYDPKENNLLDRMRKTFPKKSRFYKRVPKEREKEEVLDIAPFNRVFPTSF